MKKRLGVLLAAVALFAAACSSSGGGSGKGGGASVSASGGGASASGGGSSESGTLNVTTWSETAAGWKIWWPGLVADFEKAHPGVKVNVQQIAYADYVSSLTTQFAAGKGPQVIHVPLPLTTIPAWADAGFVADLSAFLKTTGLTKNWPSTQAALEWNGKPYGVLLEDYNYVLFYNKAALDSAGVKVPTTPEELVAAAKATTKGGKFGFAVTQDNTTNFLTDVFEFVDGEGAPWIKDGAWNFTDPAVVKAVDTWRTMATQYSPKGTDINQKRQSFFDGNSAMMIEGPFLVAQVPTSAPKDLAPNLHIASQPFPSPAGNVSNGLAIAQGLNSKTEKLAEEFVQMATSMQHMQALATDTTTPVALRDANSALSGSPDLQTVAKTATETKELIFPPSASGLRKNFNAFQQVATDTLHTLLTGNTSTADVLSQLQQTLNSKGIKP